WPGNVRELKNELARAVALATDGERLGLVHLSAKLGGAPVAAVEPTIAAVGTTDLREARDAFEASFLARVLRDHDGNVSHSAKALGISRVALQKKMKEFALR
ncbi:MAG: helix-turn-helix domain-containing protein, partial [Candidatus Binatia bacterium]